MKVGARQPLCLVASVLFTCVVGDLHAPEVHTELGSLRGEYVSVKGKEAGVHAYLGVPFAKPPVGPALRLAAPQPVERWGGVRDATKQPPMCVQHKQSLLALVDKLGAVLAAMPEMSEDCLYLNIYTPANTAHDAKLPVMVWIHGGAFTMGSASMYDGSALAAHQDVVVVLIQYRLGLLGFLSTGDEHMPGNFGLLDQVQALRWVQQHIHNFGGNPGLVTIFGESAGGRSVSLLLLSPLSAGLFHRAIAESGTAAVDVYQSKDPLPMTQMVAVSSGCSAEATEKISDCMRSLDIDSIKTDRIFKFSINVDGHFLTKPVNKLLLNHELLSVPFMTGVNTHEGGWLLAHLYAPPNWTEGMDREQLRRTLSYFYSDPQHAVIRDLLIDEYVGTGEDRVKIRDGFTEILGDLIYVIPAIKTANAHRDAGAPVFFYEYQHPPQYLKEKRPSFVRTDHGDEIFTVLGFCFTTNHVRLPEPCAADEEQLSRTMMSYWGNFARTGSPNGHALVHWPQYGAGEDYLAIGLKQRSLQHLKKNRFVFMTQTLPEKIQRLQEKKERNEL